MRPMATECGCERCRPADPWPTYTAAYRLECMARTTIALPTLQDRRAHVAEIERQQGKAVADKLRAEVLRLWKKEKA